MFELESIMNVVSFSPEVMFAVGGFVLNLLVLPTLLDSNAAIPRVQSVLSAIVLLLCFAIPYYSIGFYWPAFANSIGFVLWGLVAVYRSPSQHHRPSESSESVQSNVQAAD